MNLALWRVVVTPTGTNKFLNILIEEQQLLSVIHTDWSALIGRRQLCYAIKTQFKAPKTLSMCLYGTMVASIHERRRPYASKTR